MGIIKGISHVGIPTDNFKKSVYLYKKLGFQLINQEDNAGSKVGFFQIGDLLLEIYKAPKIFSTDALNHLALDTDNIEEAFVQIKNLGFELIDSKIQHLPFWKYGISYFNFFGPNHEVIEICQKNNI